MIEKKVVVEYNKKAKNRSFLKVKYMELRCKGKVIMK